MPGTYLRRVITKTEKLYLIDLCVSFLLFWGKYLNLNLMQLLGMNESDDIIKYYYLIVIYLLRFLHLGRFSDKSRLYNILCYYKVYVGKCFFFQI